MPFLRTLLSPNDYDDIEDAKITLNCVNGYFIENNTICICYKGWTSDFTSLDQCNIDSGENKTNFKGGIIQSNVDSNDKGTSFISIVFIIFVILLFLSIFFAIILCLLKKYKDIKLVKAKIKNEKNRKEKFGDNNRGDKSKEEKDINSKDDTKEDSIYICELSQRDCDTNNDSKVIN